MSDCTNSGPAVFECPRGHGPMYLDDSQVVQNSPRGHSLIASEEFIPSDYVCRLCGRRDYLNGINNRDANAKQLLLFDIGEIIDVNT
jgi:hypothetical protein